ncbi:peptidoglycan DD-metalloendopeptidase family protein [Streptomyces sp. ISL-22]|uniref:peptidoglycan DD-metalloendopeptidase family protein n=1 Tax=unclassified Streptomyces TaxID=2593676 RepID=UPI001BECE58B|nr:MULTISPECIES: M23 family metallopeptidase [unclassified Streptomyces]MBT2418026.1 peptidoglycan DD-metalloendopeptidase family protein [Streptomyces sp. ISL-24]MBT2432299.1 peptidoglycan DD-metalloendopeptidase family protein [Streptomyces sp. ISL-22]
MQGAAKFGIGCGGGCFGAFLGALVLAGALLGGGDSAQAAGGLNEGEVPAAYREWVIKAGSMCKEITPPVIAAQIEQESGWDPEAQSYQYVKDPETGRTIKVPLAQGISQFIPSTWETWGRDDDKNGRTSPFDPGDAIMAQGRFDCALARDVKGYLEDGAVTGDVLDLTLAAYNAGPGAVLDAGGIPNFTETRNYVTSIKALIAKYTEALEEGGSGSIPAGQKLAAPLKGNPVVSSPFGVDRPSSYYGYHTGTDFAVAVGTPVYAADAGTVTLSGWNNAYGNRIVIKHRNRDGKSVETTYNHLGSRSVEKGDSVQVGQVIGHSGNTGNSTGPHLHFEVLFGGAFVDPAPWIGL